MNIYDLLVNKVIKTYPITLNKYFLNIILCPFSWGGEVNGKGHGVKNVLFIGDVLSGC